MKRLLVALIGLCLIATGANSFWQSRQQVAVSGGVGYTGPLDVVSAAKLFAGVRAPSAAYASSLGKLANICTPADAVCADVNSDANGNFNLAGTGSLTCNNGGSICTVKILYDTSGALNCTGGTACNLQQPTIGSRPTLVVPGASNGCSTTSNYCMAFGGSATLITTGGLSFSADLDQPVTVSAVAIRTGTFTTQSQIFTASAGAVNLNFDGSTNTIGSYAGGAATATANDSVYHAVQWVVNGASSFLYIDGSSNSISSGSNSMTIANDIAIGNCDTGCGPLPLTGKMVEIGVWGSAFSGGNQSAMNTNQHSYWGF